MVTVTVGGERRTPVWLNRYLLLGSTRAGDVITITFPMVTTTEKYSLKWRQTEFWQECSLPYRSWSNDHPTVYATTFKGNTLVDVSPRDGGKGIPLYRRDALRSGTKAPVKTVTRFVANVWLEGDGASWKICRKPTDE